jgi:hypothetical protein
MINEERRDIGREEKRNGKKMRRIQKENE